MDTKVYEMEAQVEASHWWHTGRRKLFRSIINDLDINKRTEVLDVGTSTGTNLRLLNDMGFEHVTGLDNNLDAIRYCAEKGLGEVRHGDVVDLPFSEESFSLVLATDIIEHIDDDTRAIHELARVMTPGGKLLITVPTFMALWGHNDDMSHHKRRYTGSEIRILTNLAGLRIVNNFYFNFLLFIPIWAVRQLVRRYAVNRPLELEMNSSIINRVFYWIFSCDVKIAPYLHFPFGVSYLILCEKPNLVSEKT